MTRRDSLQCIHEPFGDAFYYGPERLGLRYENDEQARIGSGFSESTYKTILERLDMESAEVRRFPSSSVSSPTWLSKAWSFPSIPLCRSKKDR